MNGEPMTPQTPETLIPTMRLRWRQVHSRDWSSQVLVRSPGYPECGDSLYVLEQAFHRPGSYELVWKEVEADD